MQLEEELAEVEHALDEAEAEALRWAARVEGLRAQLDALRRAVELSEKREQRATAVPDLRLLNRTAAIEEVLRLNKSPLSIHEVIDALTAGRRDGDEYSVVAATLQQLLNQGRVDRPARGRYTAA
jgi:capsule polysaccharide export protein KpsE/RkpR